MNKYLNQMNLNQKKPQNIFKISIHTNGIDTLPLDAYDEYGEYDEDDYPELNDSWIRYKEKRKCT